MQLLTSKIPPLRLSNDCFDVSFRKLLKETDMLKIASGYISTDSLTEIKKIVEEYKEREKKNIYVNLIIGMHYFEGITRTQFEAAKYLDDYLRSVSLGKVSVVTTFKFHGKLYSFSKENSPFAAILGSSNMNALLDTHRSYETDLLIDDEPDINRKINDFIVKLETNASSPLIEWCPERFIEENPLLEGLENVKKCTPKDLAQVLNTKTGIEFEIPLKASVKHQQSNLNCYFGKGRKDKKGIIKPRHWYEIELIVSNNITQHPKYPRGIITVYTTDGWTFKCKTSGDYSKNFRSSDDLKILGKWIKGNLERAGSLKIGTPVTEAVLDNYGKRSFKLIETIDPDIWVMEF